MTPEENLAQWIQIEARARLGAQAAANAMAKYIAERTAEDTLRRNTHAPGAYYKARPGAPPSYASGSLAKGMYWRAASGGLRATAYAGNSDKRARMFEYGGCVLKPTRSTHLGWKDSGRPDNPSGVWRHRQVEVPEHPFLEPTVQEAIDDGSLRQVAIDAFIPYDP